jgi:hypothetical protein
MPLNDGVFAPVYCETFTRDQPLGVDDLIIAERPQDILQPYAQTTNDILNDGIFERDVTMAPHLNDGVLSTDYGNEYLFERIWVDPTRVNLAFIVEDLTREIKIWNAYRHRQIQTTAVSVIDQEGTLLSYPALPDTLAKFGDTIYTLYVYSEGPPLQNTYYNLTIDGDTYQLYITGIRVIPIAIDPNWDQGIVLSYEFNTTIYTTNHLREQRRPLSDDHWINIQATFDVSSMAARQVFNHIAYGQDKVFGIPIFTEKLTAATISQGDTDMTVNEDPTYYYNLQNEDFVIIVDHINNIGEIKEVSSIASTTINFNQEIGADFDADYTVVYPCLFCVITSYNSDGETDDFDVIKLDLREYKNG